MLNFSVSMCVYAGDNAEHFQIAVNSILQQTVQPNEVVLVVDGPVSGNIETFIAKLEQNELFNVIRLEKNMGHGIARRTGLEHCRNDIVALMDADDISFFNRFECQLQVFEKKPEVHIVGGQIEEFIENPEIPIDRRIVPITDQAIKEEIKYRCPMNQMTVMFRKSAVNEAGGYVDWYCNEDYYLWLRMYLKNMIFANTKECLVKVRVGNNMYGRRGGLKYFSSEAKLQNFMLKMHIISFHTWILNISKRFIVQILMPNSIRELAYKKFARKSIQCGGMK